MNIQTFFKRKLLLISLLFLLTNLLAVSAAWAGVAVTTPFTDNISIFNGEPDGFSVTIDGDLDGAMTAGFRINITGITSAEISNLSCSPNPLGASLPLAYHDTEGGVEVNIDAPGPIPPESSLTLYLDFIINPLSDTNGSIDFSVLESGTYNVIGSDSLTFSAFSHGRTYLEAAVQDNTAVINLPKKISVSKMVFDSSSSSYLPEAFVVGDSVSFSSEYGTFLSAAMGGTEENYYYPEPGQTVLEVWYLSSVPVSEELVSIALSNGESTYLTAEITLTVEAAQPAIFQLVGEVLWSDVGEQVWLSLRQFDQYGNDIPFEGGEQISLTSDSSRGVFSGPNIVLVNGDSGTAELVADQNGDSSFYFSSQDAGQIKITASLDSITSEQYLDFYPGSPSSVRITPNTVQLESDITPVIQINDSLSFKIEILDQYGNVAELDSPVTLNVKVQDENQNNINFGQESQLFFEGYPDEEYWDQFENYIYGDNNGSMAIYDNFSFNATTAGVFNLIVEASDTIRDEQPFIVDGSMYMRPVPEQDLFDQFRPGDLVPFRVVMEGVSGLMITPEQAIPVTFRLERLVGDVYTEYESVIYNADGTSIDNFSFPAEASASDLVYLKLPEDMTINEKIRIVPITDSVNLTSLPAEITVERNVTPFNRQLARGWNTLSIPVLLETGHDSLSTIIEDISAVRVAYAYNHNNLPNPWIQITGNSAGIDVYSSLAPMQAILVYVDRPTMVNFYAEDEISAPAAYDLTNGWNLVGPNAEAPKIAAEIFSEVTDSVVRVVSPGFNQEQWSVSDLSSQPFGLFSVGYLMEPGFGYWVYVNQTSQINGMLGTPAFSSDWWSIRDEVAPKAVSITPDRNQQGVYLDEPITVSFSEPVIAGPGSESGIVLMAGSEAVGCTWYFEGSILSIIPDEQLDYYTNYTVHIAADAVEDLSENTMDSDFSFSFMTYMS